MVGVIVGCISENEQIKQHEVNSYQNVKDFFDISENLLCIGIQATVVFGRNRDILKDKDVYQTKVKIIHGTNTVVLLLISKATISGKSP